MRIVYLFLVALFGIFAWAYIRPSAPAIQVRSIETPRSLGRTMLKVAVISDLHVEEREQQYRALRILIDQVLDHDPDLVVLLGDYIANPRTNSFSALHRANVIRSLYSLPRSRTALVLGNYETWDDRNAWARDLQEDGFHVLENRVRIFETNKGLVCVRGLGDQFTGNYVPTPLPSKCAQLPTISITHDPAAAFREGVAGIIFAGHTHCGQVSIPFIGPLWAPTEAPREAWCELYQDELRTLWVSSGIGTSILPIRLGTQAQWDLIHLGI